MLAAIGEVLDQIRVTKTELGTMSFSSAFPGRTKSFYQSRISKILKGTQCMTYEDFTNISRFLAQAILTRFHQELGSPVYGLLLGTDLRVEESEMVTLDDLQRSEEKRGPRSATIEEVKRPTKRPPRW